MLWEAALPPCICAIAACAVYVTMVESELYIPSKQSLYLPDGVCRGRRTFGMFFYNLS